MVLKNITILYTILREGRVGQKNWAFRVVLFASFHSYSPAAFMFRLERALEISLSERIDSREGYQICCPGVWRHFDQPLRSPLPPFRDVYFKGCSRLPASMTQGALSSSCSLCVHIAKGLAFGEAKTRMFIRLRSKRMLTLLVKFTRQIEDNIN